MTILDWVLVILLVLAFLGGFKRGLISTLGGIIGLVVGAVLAGQFYDVVAGWLSGFGWLSEATLNIVAFIVILLAVASLVSIIFGIIGKIFKIIQLIPFLGLINRFGGAILGLVEEAILLGIALNVAARFFEGMPAGDYIALSAVAVFLVWVGGLLIPLLPEAIKHLDLPF